MTREVARLYGAARSVGALGAIILFATASYAAPTQSEPQHLSPVRTGLQAIPLPRLDDLEPAVSAQFREAHRSFLNLSEGKRPSGAELAEAYGSLGRLFHVYEFFESAEASYANAARLAPSEASWPHLLGYLYQQTGRLEEAVDRLGEARRIRPDDYTATVRLGQVYLGLNRLREAREEFQRVVEIFPALAQSGLGEIALREQRFKDAIEHFGAALERVPQATSIHYSLAMAYRGLGRVDEARTHLQQRGSGGVRIGDPIVDALQILVRGERGLVVQGRRAYEAGQFQEASDAFARAVDAAPASAPPRVNLGLARLQLGRTSDAVEQFEAALRLDPANLVAHASLGLLFASQHRDPDAVGHLRAAFEQAPDDESVSRELTRALVRLRRDDEAIEVLKRVRTFDPDDEDALVSLSILLAAKAQYAEAVVLLDGANRRFPDRTATATTLARMLASSPDLALRNGRRALELATAVYTSEPAPVHGETIALALAELGRCGEALDWMKRAITEADLAKDAAERARLTSEIRKYEAASCRPSSP